MALAESNDAAMQRRPTPGVICPICSNYLAISCLPYPSPDDNNEMPDYSGAALNKVLKDWQRSGREVPKCVFCRHELCFTANGCGHMIEAVHMTAPTPMPPPSSRYCLHLQRPTAPGTVQYMLGRTVSDRDGSSYLATVLPRE